MKQSAKHQPSSRLTLDQEMQYLHQIGQFRVKISFLNGLMPKKNFTKISIIGGGGGQPDDGKFHHVFTFFLTLP